MVCDGSEGGLFEEYGFAPQAQEAFF